MLAAIADILNATASWNSVLVFLLLALTETLRPAHHQPTSPLPRWLGHALLFILSAAAVAAIEPVPWLATHFGNSPAAPVAQLGTVGGDWLVLAVSIAAMDLYIYAFHRLQHTIFTLWRFHAVHHADTQVDASTSLRHHPVESLLNAFLGALIFVPLGIPLWTYPFYNFLARNVGLMQHANIRLPSRLETVIDLVFIGPALHRAHHANDPSFYNTNFGVIFSLWDRLFRTYRCPNSAEQSTLVFGIEEVTRAGQDTPLYTLPLPFLLRRPAS